MRNLMFSQVSSDIQLKSEDCDQILKKSSFMSSKFID